MLRICIPVHNEATTIGVLLWRLRSVFQGFSREYDVVVYDDASTDGTGEVLEPYQSVMPLTVVRGDTHRGYASSIDALVRHVAADDEYARRDAMVLLQGDFTESPEHLPELVKRFEGGADLVAVHRTLSDATPVPERRLRRWGRWAVTPFLRLPPVADPFTGFRLVRISVLRDLLRALGSRPVCAGDGWAANIDFALNVTPFAKRIENVEFAPRYDVRQRASRRRGWPDVVALFHWARGARRAVRPTPSGKPAESAPRPAAASRAPDLTPRTAPTSQSPERSQRPPRSAPPAPKPTRTDKPARVEKPARAAAVEQPATPRMAPPTAEPVAAGTDVAAGDGAAAPARKSKRRRRRSRRGRGAGSDEAPLLEAGAAADVTESMTAADDDAGTSDDGEGEEEAGATDAAAGETPAGGATGGEQARRKRKARRRRRGRRPGGQDTIGSDGAAPPVQPPSAEPPAA